MSNLAFAPARAPHRSTAPKESPARLIEIVPSRRQRITRPRPYYAVVTIGGIIAIVLGQLLLSIVVADGAYQISALQVDKTELARTETSLSEQVDTLASTQNLATLAEKLGMVQGSTTPAFLDAETGKVIGKSRATTTSSDSVIAESGSLVPNSLLAGATDPLADDASAATDATDGTTSTSTSTTSGLVVTGPGGAATGAGATGAPDAPVDTGSVASDSGTTSGGLPVPKTR